MKILLLIVGVIFAFFLFFFFLGIVIELSKSILKYGFKMVFVSFAKGQSVFNGDNQSFIPTKRKHLPKPNSIDDKSLYLRFVDNIEKDYVYIFKDVFQCEMGAGNGVPKYNNEYLFPLQGMPSIEKPRYLIAQSKAGSFFMVFPSPHLITSQEYVYGTEIELLDRKTEKYDKFTYYTKVQIKNKEEGTFIHIPTDNILYYFDVTHIDMFNQFYFSLLNKEVLGLKTDLNQFVKYLLQTYSTEYRFIKEQAKALQEADSAQTYINDTQSHSENIISLKSKKMERMERLRKDAN